MRDCVIAITALDQNGFDFATDFQTHIRIFAFIRESPLPLSSLRF